MGFHLPNVNKMVTIVIKVCILRCLVCGFGHFGQNCSQICHCYDNVSCDPFSGLCPNSKCSYGWQGPSCNIETGTSNDSTIITTQTSTNTPYTEVTNGQMSVRAVLKQKVVTYVKK
ncbi:hypothetical protein MAR_022991 [Mya arenaria]|uniref:EGF-like domain-containing protein n=1 Tax=Mya arenaria TaxID=6604 RepID=A0ABY7DLP0_MYAAR|nr:hypothetical protein MAR_022984 [Mya arenaria]WAQ98618.1 hypothetical protein MAR_022991 [Mya arenaria]